MPTVLCKADQYQLLFSGDGVRGREGKCFTPVPGKWQSKEWILGVLSLSLMLCSLDCAACPSKKNTSKFHWWLYPLPELEPDIGSIQVEFNASVEYHGLWWDPRKMQSSIQMALRCTLNCGMVVSERAVESTAWHWGQLQSYWQPLIIILAQSQRHR